MKASTALVAMGASLAVGLPATAQPTSTVVGFDGGSNGGFQGNAFFEPIGGNPDGRARHLSPDLFFNDLRTGAIGEPTNAAFLGDYSAFTDITLSFDMRVDTLRDELGNQITRSIGIKLIDRDIQGTSGSSGVFFELDLISESRQDGWTTLSVTIADPTQAALPAGWIGFGEENPITFEPVLPAGATFASVLASVDEMHITGAVPGFFFRAASFDVSIDNISLVVPAPASAALLGFGGLIATRRRR